MKGKIFLDVFVLFRRTSFRDENFTSSKRFLANDWHFFQSLLSKAGRGYARGHMILRAVMFRGGAYHSRS